jgi:EAL and modified HD-GYP domain-containing signal transduction protein
MDAPMAEVLRSIPFPEDMTHALVAGHGKKGEVLDCALACERGDVQAAPLGTATRSELAAAQSDAIAWATTAMAELFEEPVAA